MSQPLIIDGHARKVTMTLPSSCRITRTDSSTVIEIDSAPTAPFTGLAVKEGNVDRFRTPDFQKTWTVTIE